MGLFDIFKRPSSDDTGRELGQKIVAAALTYRTLLEDDLAPDLSMAAGAEICYFFTHLVDVTAYLRLTGPVRSSVVVATQRRVLQDYPSACFGGQAPATVIAEIRSSMGAEFRSRQGVYGGCRRMIGDDPMNLLSFGSLYGVLGYFLLRATGHISDELSIEQLLGEDSADDFDRSSLFFEAIRLVPFLTETQKLLNLDACLSRLR